MYRPRIIPVLLLKDKLLYKSVKFEKHNYIGDPLNAVRIFNDLKVDEIAFLDINASKEDRLISIDLVKEIGEEANMPFSVGGGIKTIDDIQKVIQAGAEKVIIGTSAVLDPDFIKVATETFGSSTITVCIDVKKGLLGGHKSFFLNGKRSNSLNPIEFAQQMEQLGVGELIVQSIDRDGKRNGYDIQLIKKISESVEIPIVALGGAGDIHDLKELHNSTTVNGLAAGSMFVYLNKKGKGVLINYPEPNEIKSLLF